ncbi:MAG: ornithine carbamoyltransferase [Anaerolineae bacterium UTCFX5]|nr:MAG: ornithine carbamoyltransferase [Anaerolineae bacterium UTCFX5]
MRHFLSLDDWSTDELRALIDEAAALKAEYLAGGNRKILKGKVLGMIFQKPSLRTRVSFDVGMQHLGGSAVMLGQNEIGLGKREAISDIARVLSGMVHGIMARVFDHNHVVELAKWSGVPVINGLSDDHHPCQVMADVLTIREHFGRTDGLKLAYIGDGNNVASSLLFMCAHFGIDFSIASPPGYAIPQAVVDAAMPVIQRSEIEFTQVERPEDAATGADVLYTDTWISMGQEDEAGERIAAFAGYQINAALLDQAKPDAVVMHDLPAYRGKEITDEMMDGPRAVIFQQAHNRLHAQKAILARLLGS